MAQSSVTKMKMPNALFELGVNNENTQVRGSLFNVYNVYENVSLSMLLANSPGKLMIFFLFFPENRG